VIPSEGLDEKEVLRVAAGVEQQSEHPLAEAIVRAARESHITVPSAADFESFTGEGVSGLVQGQRVLVGRADFLSTHGVPQTTQWKNKAATLQQRGQTVIFVAMGKQMMGLVSVADSVKESTAEAIRTLHGLGLKVVMLTGDNKQTAEAVAAQLGIDEVEAEVDPQRKSDRVRALRQAGQVVAMAGDGINDAPALAAADVGIAMGTGTDVAMESAGITLMHGDLRGIEKAVRLSHAMMNNIRQNLFFAFLYNSLGVPIAAGVLYPFFGLVLSPMIAGAAMSLSSVSVIANALRLRSLKL
jgi:Cu+-exporting ATPase